MNTKPKNSLSELLLALRRRINDNVKGGRLNHELTLSQLEALWFIQTAGTSTMESIAAHLGIKAPSVTTLIDKLERAGYVSRARDKRDRRVIYVTLVEKTERELVALRKEKETFFNTLLAKLSAKDRKELVRVLSLLVTK